MSEEVEAKSVINLSEKDMAQINQITQWVTSLFDSAKGFLIVLLALLSLAAGLIGYVQDVKFQVATNAALDAQVSATATAIAPVK